MRPFFQYLYTVGMSFSPHSRVKIGKKNKLTLPCPLNFFSLGTYSRFPASLPTQIKNYLKSNRKTRILKKVKKTCLVLVKNRCRQPLTCIYSCVCISFDPLFHRVHTVATTTFHHDGKISPGWCGWGLHALPSFTLSNIRYSTNHTRK